MKGLAALFEMYKGLAKVRRMLIFSYLAFALSGLSLWLYLEHSNRNIIFAWLSAITISVYIVFYLIFYGYRAEVKGPSDGDRLEMIVNLIVYGVILSNSIMDLLVGWQFVLFCAITFILLAGSMFIGVRMTKKKFKKFD